MSLPVFPTLTAPVLRRAIFFLFLTLPRALIALVCALAATIVAAPASGGLQMYMGAAEDEGRNADPQVAMTKMELAKAAGFDTIRITALWAPGQSAVPAGSSSTR